MTTLTLLLVLPAGTLAGGQASGQGPDQVLKWNEVALETIRVEKTPPPLAARNLAMMHLAIYDAVTAVQRTHQPFLVSAVPVGEAAAPEAAAAAGHRVLSALYPRQALRLDAVLARCLAELPVSSGRDEGLDLGRFVADRVLEWRRQDGAANGGRHSVRRALGFWEPTPPDFQPPLLPDWGNVQPFAIRPGTQLRPPGPPQLSSEAYLRSFEEVKALGGRHGSQRTEDQTIIAHFWADNVGTSTPAGHWNLIAQEIARQRGTNLAENARLFALLNVSLADAGILCWVIKFSYDFWRPVTGIRQAALDDNGGTEPDGAWTPLLDTPPFPSYTSGHSTFSGAAAAALASCFGSDAIPFTSISEGLPGVRRSFTGFWSAAEEAGMSRIYGGIHWQFDNVDALAMGRALGNYVARHHFQPLAPRQRPPVLSFERLPGAE
jgi:membrane-associated phospholipid phosphatase